MIKILDKKNCVGCEGCVQICPKQCISFNIDDQGFRYPKVDLTRCIQCNLCEKVCPVIHQGTTHEPKHVYSAKNISVSVIEQSSSAGIFFALAEWVINQGGVVFGARFNSEWLVEHSYADTVDSVRAFQKSKYVQSVIGRSFQQVEMFLKAGRKVLFSGTPCQIAALKLFLRRDYGEQLLSVDFVCHGVPSPLIWSKYLKEICKDFNRDLSNLQSINFRDKRKGWKNYGLCLKFKDDNSERDLFIDTKYNLYLQGFINNLFLRPACFKCPAKFGKSKSDITLGDFWGIERTYPKLYLNGMYSLLMINSIIGKNAIKSVNRIEYEPVTFENVIKYNPSIKHSSKETKYTRAFWRAYSVTGLNALDKTIQNLRPSVIKQLYYKFRFVGAFLIRKLKLD